MTDDRIQISRDSQELGVLSPAEADELLRAGFLLPTDSFRTDEHQPWQPLKVLSQGAPATTPLARFKGAATSVRANVSRVAAQLVSATGRGGSAVGTAGALLLEDYLPRIRASVGAALIKSAGTIDARLQDEGFQRKIFGAAYDTLPKPVHRFVDEAAFVEFCFQHRSKLLVKKD